MLPIRNSSEMSQEGHGSDGDVEMGLNTDQVTTEVFTGRTDKTYSIEEINKICNEKAQEAKTAAEKTIEMIEADRKKKVEKISQLRTELTNTINDANIKINKIYEDLKKI
ncbi:unnamed protein product [Rhizophagus irregularis]|uniref:Uncharacterized protein n=1 Tax=Rhizophagus irregularis TaxID=588596 RepID=A0A2N1NYA4_9GLOM|nr:hypothetical protein RhiirC2_843129 [Rhizophagus irregularis]CAB4389447.1 unnamed protein product [Rhizophagus irregularis]CAB5389482.1 unnamed protein product [Rhizophagus irregularis]